MEFVADAMLGKLAKWLRVLGYDTLYQSRYGPGGLYALAAEGRVLLSRDRRALYGHQGALWIRADKVGDQLMEMRQEGLIRPTAERLFTRCLRCNVLLKTAAPEEVEGAVPEFVLHQTRGRVRRCTVCGRHYWPGTHRDRMMDQLRAWGLLSCNACGLTSDDDPLQ